MLNTGKTLISEMLKAPYVSGRWLKGKPVGQLSYMPEFKLGKPINSGLDADVFEIKKYPDLVARVDRKTVFNPFELMRTEDNVRHIWASNADETVTIMRKVKGKPLHGKNWMIGLTPDKKEYMKTLDEVLKLPDSTFHHYIDQLEKIRANGCQVDTINPNNILLDTKTKQANIIDIEPGKNIKHYTNAEDFYPFVDEKRLIRLLRSMTPAERDVLTKKFKQFFARIEKIGKERNIDLTLEKPDHTKLQDISTYIVYDDKEMLDIYLC